MPRYAAGQGRAAKEPDADELNRRRFELQTNQGIAVEDLNLPKSMVQRLAKGVLSPNTVLQKEAILAYTKSATVFVSYLANSANDHAVLAGKKTIQPRDVLAALKELEFEAFLPRCEAELEKYNAMLCEKRNTYRQRVREEKKAAMKDGEPAADTSTLEANGENGDSSIHLANSSPPSQKQLKRQNDEPPNAKRARMSEGALDEMDDESEGDFEDAQEQQDDEDEELEDEAAEGESEHEEEMQEDALEERPATADDDDDEDDDDSGSDSE